MKILRTLSLLAACLFAASVTSCVSDGLTEPGNDVVGKEIATLEEQAASVAVTVADVKALKETVEGHDAELDRAIKSLEGHLSLLRDGSSWEDATLATLAEQKKLASVVGSILAQAEPAGATKTCLNSLDANAKAWLGKNMETYWSAALAEARVNASLTVLGSSMKTQMLHVEGLASDIEAGLRKDEKPEELKALAKSVASNIETADKLRADMTFLVSELEDTYRTAVQAAAQDPASYDTKSVSSMNRAAAVTLSASEVTLESLAARVADCETRLTAIETRLGVLETEMEELLALIQSVNLMQDNSSDYAVAYYNLDPDQIKDDGCMTRVPKGTIDLRYLIRPASAAAALTESTLWNNGLKVIGYYAQSITKASVETFDLTVQNVVEDANIPGLVTVTVVNAFDSEDFYLKKIGAKVALSITSGNNDITSKFVEIIPQDESGTVYAESLTVTESVEIELNETATLKAVLNPTGADQALTWESDNEDVVTVSDEGVLTTTGVGTAVVTATSVVTDEYGRKLSATCDVTVNPDIRIVGPNYVEKGYSINLRIDTPRNINPDAVEWSTSHSEIITITPSYADGINSAAVAASASAYNGGYEDVTISCDVAGETVLTHTIQCVEIQPKRIEVEGLDNDVNEVTLKFGQSRTFNASVNPASVDATKFTWAYSTSGEGIKDLQGQTITAYDEEHLKEGKVTGYFNIDLNSAYYWYDKTIQASAEKLSRTITVNVEPYYVTAVRLPASYILAKDDVFDPKKEDGFIVFTSDDPEGVEPPSYTDLVWESSDPELVSFDETTGKFTANQLASSVIIKASVKDPRKAVAPDAVVPEAQCVIAVVEAGAGKPQVGDYYYDDGTWSTDPETGKNVIGIIFSLENAADDDTGDPTLDDKYIHGLVVSTTEFTARYSSKNDYSCPLADTNNKGSIYECVRDNYSGANYDFNKLNGYTSTLALRAWRNKHFSSHSCLVGELDSDLAAAPAESSGWYIPSYKELLLLYGKKDAVNTSISAISGTQILQQYYWSSSLYHFEDGTYDESNANPFDMTSGTMTQGSSYGPVSTYYPVRAILAF